MKRTFSFGLCREPSVIVAGTAFIAATYGLVRLAYGLFLPDIQADLALDSARAGGISPRGGRRWSTASRRCAGSATDAEILRC